MLTTEPINPSQLTCVKLHEGGDELIDWQRVVLDQLKEALGARLNCWVSNKQHLHQLGNQVGVSDVVLTANEHHQEGRDVLSAGLIKNLRRIPSKERKSKWSTYLHLYLGTKLNIINLGSEIQWSSVFDSPKIKKIKNLLHNKKHKFCNILNVKLGQCSKAFRDLRIQGQGDAVTWFDR